MYTGMRSISHTGSIRYDVIVVIVHSCYCLFMHGTGIHKQLTKQERASLITFVHLWVKWIGNTNMCIEQTNFF